MQRAADRSTVELSTGVRWERLTPVHDSKVDFLEVVYEPGGQSSESGRSIRHDGRELAYREFDKLTHVHQGEVVPHKRLGAMLATLTQQQLAPEKRSVKCPTRRYPAPARLT